MSKYLLFFVIVCLAIGFPKMDVFSAEHNPDKEAISRWQASRTPQDADAEPVYPLYRQHSKQYYPMLSSRKAVILSATMPGLGQAYADNYLKASLFLTAEIGVFALASYNIARALHYRSHDTFRSGFLDERTDSFLDRDQVRSRMTDHSIRGTLFLITGIGLHVWNIVDAKKTAEAYNNRRIFVQMQQTKHGTHALIFTHRF